MRPRCSTSRAALPDVRIRDDAHAAELLDAAFGQFFDLLEHCARFHRGAIRPGLDLEIDQETSRIWIAQDLPQVSPL